MQLNSVRIWRSATFKLRMPPPTGVVSGPLIAMRYSLIAAIVSSGSHELNWLKAFSPANTSYQATFFEPPEAFSTAASKTLREAIQMSRPVPSPSMNGMIGLSGTMNFPFSTRTGAPSVGTGTPL